MGSPTMTTNRRLRWTIGDILDRTDLAALLDEHAAAIGNGHRRRWHCPVPDHHDSHASVTMHTDARGHERWRCWSGDDTHRGDAIDLIMATHRIGRAAAIEHLAARSGLRLDEPLPPPRRRPTPTAPTGPVPLDPAVVAYIGVCEKILWSRAGEPVRNWLASRGFTDELLLANRIGADPGRARLNRTKGLPSGQSVAATFPALGPDGAVTYVQTRYLQPRPDGPKYENPAARLGSNPRIAWTVPTGEQRSKVLVVCEGIPDALTAAQQGLNSVAILGAQAPDAKLAETLADHANVIGVELVAVVDADPAGRAWGSRLTDLLSTRDTSLTVVEPPIEGLDLNDWAARDTEWATAVVPDRPSIDLTPASLHLEPEVSLT